MAEWRLSLERKTCSLFGAHIEAPILDHQSSIINLRSSIFDSSIRAHNACTQSMPPKHGIAGRKKRRCTGLWAEQDIWRRRIKNQVGTQRFTAAIVRASPVGFMGRPEDRSYLHSIAALTRMNQPASLHDQA